MENKPKTIVLLDGNALIHRAYHALPPLTTKEGQAVGAVYGFTMTLLAALEKFKPDYIAASFDLAGPTFRDELYADYKATRVKAPDDLYAQIPIVKNVVRAFNIPIYEKEGFEADDVIGTLAKQATRVSEGGPRRLRQGSGVPKEGVRAIVVTGDSDTLQLVDDQVFVFTLRKGIKDTFLYDAAAVREKYGFGPEQLIEYKGLAGDSSDNIPGVPGVGAKTAAELLKQYETLEEIYAHLDDLKPALAEKLKAGKESAFLSRKLGTINIAVPVDLALSDCVTHDFDREKVVNLLRSLGFMSLISRIPGAQTNVAVARGKKKKQIVMKKLKTAADVNTFLAECEGKDVAVVIESEMESLFGSDIKTLLLTTGGDREVSASWDEETKKVFAPWLSGAAKKIFFDTKGALHLLAKENVRLAGTTDDVSLMAYLLSSGTTVDFPALIVRELGEECAAARAAALFALRERFLAELTRISKEQADGNTLLQVYRDVELPLIPILAAMEEAGILLDKNILARISEELAAAIADTEKKIHAFAGREFNINSPKQLAEILFDELKIPSAGIKRGKTGISTASTELAKLRDYPIALLVEEYRELFKLKTTYVDVLPTLADTESRIHTTYQQDVAATGRLSSINPNLQNIPVRSAWGERIRSAFVAGPGRVLVSADYSQIELRVMAHVSGDEALTAAFRAGEDVHRTTAAVVYKVKPDEVTDAMRRQAKVFNFGIMYGMGAFGLAQAAEIDQKEAKKFIDTYFEKFSGVRAYLDETIRLGKERGFVETPLGRRRYVPELASGSPAVARAGERMAVNMPIQGFAADIMKLAMIAADTLVFERYAGKATMLLQVHDELIFEVREEDAVTFAKELDATMEHVIVLSVPLTVSTAIGKHWGEI